MKVGAVFMKHRGSNSKGGAAVRTKLVATSLTAVLVMGTLMVTLPASATTKKVVTCYKLVSNVVHTEKFHGACAAGWSKNKPKPKPLTAVTLTLDDNIPAGGALNTWLSQWVSNVESQSKGKISITEYAQNVLYTNVASVPAVQSNELNMSFVDVGSITDALPNFGAMELPIPGITDTQLAEYSGPTGSLFTAEQKYLGQHGLYIIPTPSFLPSSQAMMLKAPITSLSQLTGQKIRSIGGSMDTLLQGLGADPIDMPSSQVPTSLQTGAISGAVGSLGVMSTTWAGLGDEAVVFGNLIPGIYWMVVSSAEWAKLSVADRDFLTATWQAEYNSYKPLEAGSETNQESQWLATKGNQIYRPTSAENAQLATIATSIWTSFSTSAPSFYSAAVATGKKFKISLPVK